MYGRREEGCIEYIIFFGCGSEKKIRGKVDAYRFVKVDEEL